MARRVDNKVLIVSALAAFFATLSGMLIVVQPDPAPPLTPAPVVLALPEVAAPLPVRQQAYSVEPPRPLSRVQQRLEEFGVECGSGDCFPGS